MPKELTTPQKALIERLENDLRRGPFVDGDFTPYSLFMTELSQAIDRVERERYRKVLEAQGKARAERRKKDNEYRPKLVAWAKANLKPGMYVKMRGCRDGHGLREITEIVTDPKGYGRQPTIKCWKLEFQSFWWTKRDDLPNQTPDRVQKTEHLMDKVIGLAEICTPEEAKRTRKRFTYKSVKKLIAESEDK